MCFIYNFVIILFFAIISFLLLAITYCVNSYGVMCLLREKGCKNYKCAWIPVYRNYILAELAEKEFSDASFINKWIFSFGWIAAWLPNVGLFCGILYLFYHVIVLHKFGEKYGNEFSMVLSTLLGFYGIGCHITASNIKEELKKKTYENVNFEDSFEKTEEAEDTEEKVEEETVNFAEEDVEERKAEEIEE